MDLIKTIEEQQKKEGSLNFSVGDTVKVHFEIIEGKTKRIQIYEGVVIAIKNTGVRKTFTVRKISYGVGVERVFPVFSPRVVRVEVVRVGKYAALSSTTSVTRLVRVQKLRNLSVLRLLLIWNAHALLLRQRLLQNRLSRLR